MDTDYWKPMLGTLIRSLLKCFGAYEAAASDTTTAQITGGVLAAIGVILSIKKHHDDNKPVPPPGIPPTPQTPKTLAHFLPFLLILYAVGCSTVRTDIKVPIYVIAVPSITNGMSADQVYVMNRGKEFFDAKASLTKYQALVTVRTNSILINVGYSGLNQEAYGTNIAPAIGAAGTAVGNAIKSIVTPAP